MWNPHLPAAINLVNESGEDVQLVNQNGRSDAETCARGKSDYWKVLPCAAGKVIHAGETFEVGVMNSVTFFDSPSWIYFSYSSNPNIIIQVHITMTGPADPRKGIWISIGPYDGASTEYTPMPRGSRMELVEYDLATTPYTTNKVYIPPVHSWTFFKVDPIPAPDNSGQIIAIIANVCLSTLITACFVIPSPVSGIAAGAVAISDLGEAAIALTAVQGILNMVTTLTGQNQVAAAFGPRNAYSSYQWTAQESLLRQQMDNAQADYSNKESGYNKLLLSIAERVNKQLSSGVVFDDAMKKDTGRCLRFLRDITSSNGIFQQHLIECLDLNASTSTPTAPPDKGRLVLGIAGLCMTVNAFCNGYMLRSFVEVTGDKTLLEELPDVKYYDAESLIEYLNGKIELVRQFDLYAAANSQRLGDITLSTDQISTEGHPDESPYQFWDRCVLTDKTSKQAMWGAYTFKDADDFMAKQGFEPADPLNASPSREWHAKEHYDNFGPRNTLAHNVYAAYTAAVSNLVQEDIKKLRDEALVELENSCVPYMANLRRPHKPMNALTVNDVTYASNPMSTTTLHFTYVQYGYAFSNAFAVDGDILWTDARVLSPRAGENSQSFAPIGCVLAVPEDPWNLKAKILSEKANKLISDSKVTTSGPSSEKAPALPSVPPPYPTACRLIYRRFFLSLEATYSKEPNLTEKLLGKLMNNAGNAFQDSWSEKNILSGQE